MKRKINCSDLGKIFLCLLARYLCYSEICNRDFNFTCANVIIYSKNKTKQRQNQGKTKPSQSALLNVPRFSKCFSNITAIYCWIICYQGLSIPPFEECQNSVCTSRSSYKKVGKKLARQSSIVNPCLPIASSNTWSCIILTSIGKYFISKIGQ